ncbi:hypothetical protein EON79_15950 [bacterium]|nr:MAG: hypothetical protein EON79_15950 [bacterium]
MSGNSDIVVTKQDRRGLYVWTRRIDLSSNDQGRAIDLRPNGNVIVTGTTVSGGATRLFLAELSNADGSVVWQRIVDNGGSQDTGNDVKVAPDGSIVVAGSSTALLGLLEVPRIMKFNSDGTSQLWSFELAGIGTARHLVLDGGTVFYAGERRLVELLGVQAAGNAFVGRCNLSNGGSRDNEVIGLGDLTYEKIHKLEPAGPGRVVFSGWKGLSILGQGAIPVYGVYNGSSLTTVNGGGNDTVATDIAYDPVLDQIAVLRTSVVTGGTTVSVQVGAFTSPSTLSLSPAVPLPGTNSFAHSVGFTPDSKWYAYYASDQGGAMALGSTSLISIEMMERLSLGWSAIGLPASEHPPQAKNGRAVYLGGDTIYGGRVANNSYLTGPADEFRFNEDTMLNQDVLRNDGVPFFGVRGGEVSLQPLHGTASVSNGRLIYTPNPNFYGSDRLTYKLQLNGTTLAYIPVKLTVVAVNDAPTVNDKEYTIRNNAGVVFDVLNDASDVESSTLKITGVTQPSSGVASIHGSKTKVVYKPVRGFVGTVTFTFTTRDTGGISVDRTVTVNVTN